MVWRVLVSILVWTAIGWIFSLADLNCGHYEYSLRVNLLEFSAGASWLLWFLRLTDACRSQESSSAVGSVHIWLRAPS